MGANGIVFLISNSTCSLWLYRKTINIYISMLLLLVICFRSVLLIFFFKFSVYMIKFLTTREKKKKETQGPVNRKRCLASFKINKIKMKAPWKIIWENSLPLFNDGHHRTQPFLAALSVLAPNWNNSEAYQQENG